VRERKILLFFMHDQSMCFLSTVNRLENQLNDMFKYHQ